MADYSQTATSVIPSARAVIVKRKAASTVAAGQPVRLVTATTVSPADANLSAAAALVFGIAISGGGTGQWIWIVVKDPALGIGITLAVGDIVILSATAGGIAPASDAASGMYITVLGVAISTTAINFNPIAAGAVKA